MYLRYALPRALRSLRANWRASLAHAVILAASLAVLGMIVLLYLNVVHFSHAWLSDTTVSLFLQPDTGVEQREAVLARAREHPLVRDARLVPPEEGLRALAERLGADHALLATGAAGALPYTVDFEVVVEQRDRIASLARTFRALPQVEEVVYTEQLLEQVELFFLLVQGIGLFFIALILASFALIVSHATRLSLHARRAEIEILDLVGATRAFIRSSFVVEGALVSLAGGLLASALVWFCFRLLLAGLSWNEFTRGLKAESVFFPPQALGAALLVAGVLGAVSSHVAVNRVLRELEP